MLILQRKEGESLLIGDNVEISVLSVEAADEEAPPLELLGVLKEGGPEGSA